MSWFKRKTETEQTEPKATRTALKPVLRICEQDERAALVALENFKLTGDHNRAMSRFRLYRKAEGL